MTTARDLLIVAMDRSFSLPVERGDLSLALAGAEVTDLLGAGVIGLDGDRIVPVPDHGRVIADQLLNEAASTVAGQEPHETVADFLWRRGRDLSSAYLAVLEAEGLLARQRRRRWLVFHSSRLVLVDSRARHLAASRWRSDEPVLVALAAAVGIREKRIDDTSGVTDEAVARVLSAVDDALWELAAERQRRDSRRDRAATDNVRRGY
jgi:hypothetical protein